MTGGPIQTSGHESLKGIEKVAAQFPSVIQGLADQVQAFKNEVNDNYPVSSAWVSEIAMVETMMRRCQTMAEGWRASLRRGNAADFKRAEEPRKGRRDVEAKADTQNMHRET